MPEIFGENADRLTTVEMRMKGMPRGYISRLYEAARKHHQRPLGLLAAECLKEAIAPGDRVLITTGAGSPLWLPSGETDGPLGAAALAFSLARGLGAVPVFVSEEQNMGPILVSAMVTGLQVMDYERSSQRHMAASSFEFPMGDEEGRQAAGEALDRFAPGAVISSEKMGVNTQGVSHTVRGIRTDGSAAVHHLVSQARERDILTIGIGDGGNEIGFGTISEAVREIMPYGRKCQCPCGAGNADITPADVVVVGTASNWGAYNIAASLAYLLEKPEVLHTPETEWRMLDACVRAGCGDGIYATTEMLVDGMGVEVQTALITMLHALVKNALTEFERPY